VLRGTAAAAAEPARERASSQAAERARSMVAGVLWRESREGAFT
jgi:hypothetical protein